jgi:lipopolysaccharide transport system ATP-binding protein
MHGELTGRENIYLNGSILGLRKFEIDQRFDEIVDFSGVEQFIDTPVKRYSSGMYVRLGFAVAAHLDPNVLIVDEVLAVGDAEFRKKALGKMKNVSEGEDRTILFVSHNMGAIENLCQRTILLEKGRIIEDGNSSSVIARYLFGEEGQSAEKVWEATSTTNAPDIHVPPGQEIGCFKAIRTIDNSEKLCKSFSVRDNIYLQMEYEIFKDIREYIEITYWLNNERGELVFLTFDPSLYENGCFRSKGSYKSTCKIPGDLLNCGTYKVSALIQKKDGVYLREIDVMSFNVRDDWDKNGARGLCRPNKQWPPAVIRPKLEWKTVPV